MLLAAEAVRKFIDMADQVKILRAKINLLTDSADDAKMVFSELKDIAKETGQSLEDTGHLWQSFARSLKGTSASQGQILNLVATIQKMGVISGATKEQINDAMRQFGQAIDGGVLHAEEFNSILENTPYIAQTMAKNMGMSMGEFRAQMLDGKITAEMMVNAIQSSTEDVNKEFGQLPRTVGMAFNDLTVSVLEFVDAADKTFAITDALVGVIDSCSANVKVLGDGVKFAGKCFDTLTTAGEEFIGMFKDVAVQAGEVADEIIRMVTPIKALMDGYSWAKEIVGKQKDELNSNYEKKFGPTVGKAMAFSDDIKAITTPGKGKSEDKPKDGKITGFARVDTDKGKSKKGKKAGLSAGERERQRLEQGGLDLVNQYDTAAGLAYRRKEAEDKLNAALKAGLITEQQRAEALRKFDIEEARRANAQKDQAKRFTSQIQAQYLTTKDPVTGRAIDPTAQITMEEERKKAALDVYREDGLLSEQQYQDALTQIQQTAALERQAIVEQEKQQEIQAYSELSSSMGSLFGAMANAAANSLGEQSGVYKAMFALQQSFAIASAIISAQTAMAKALASGATPADMMAGMAAVASVGAQIVSTIQGVSFGGGRYNGGSVNGNKFYRVGERGAPELFRSGGKQYMIPGENGRVIPNRNLDGGNGGGGITMNNTFNITAENGWTERDSKALQQTIENTAMRLMQRESTRPGGMLQGRRR